MGVVVAVGLVSLAAGVQAAGAAMTWQPIETLAVARGASSPEVGLYPDGHALAVYSDATRRPASSPSIRLSGRKPDGVWRALGVIRGAFGADPQLAISGTGATAIAAVDDGRIVVVTYASPGPAALGGANSASPRVVSIVGAAAIGEPALGIDDAGNATVVWRSAIGGDAASVVQVKATTVGPSGAVAPVESLGLPGACLPELAVNAAGAAVVSGNCAGRSADVFYRPAGGAFGAAEEPFAQTESPNGTPAHVGVALDGGGTVHAYEETLADGPPGKGPMASYSYAQRPPQGPFGAPSRLAAPQYFDGPLDLVAFDDGRVLIAWRSIDDAFFYSSRPPGGDFGAPRQIAARGRTSGMSLVGSRGGQALLSWRERSDELTDVSDPGAPEVLEQPAVALLRPDGTAEVARVGTPGYLGSASLAPLAFAIGDGGRAVGAWEQRCSRSGGFAVTAIALDSRSGRAEPPCQDRSAPKVAVRPRHARVVGRVLRVRAGCNETCRMVVRARVLRAGLGKPLATSKTRRPRSIAGGRYRAFALRLTAKQAAAIHSALAARRRVRVRLALSVGDGFENGAVRRVAVPLRR